MVLLVRHETEHSLSYLLWLWPWCIASYKCKSKLSCKQSDITIIHESSFYCNFYVSSKQSNKNTWITWFRACIKFTIKRYSCIGHVIFYTHRILLNLWHTLKYRLLNVHTIKQKQKLHVTFSVLTRKAIQVHLCERYVLGMVSRVTINSLETFLVTKFLHESCNLCNRTSIIIIMEWTSKCVCMKWDDSMKKTQNTLHWLLSYVLKQFLIMICE